MALASIEHPAIPSASGTVSSNKTKAPVTPLQTPMKRKRTASMSSAASNDSTFGMKSLDTSMSSSSGTAATQRLSAIPRSLREEKESGDFRQRVLMSPRSEHVARTMGELHLKEGVVSYASGSDDEETRLKRKIIRFRDDEEVIGQSSGRFSDSSDNENEENDYHDEFKPTSVKATAPLTERSPPVQLPCSLSRRTKRCRRTSPPPLGHGCDWEDTDLAAFAYTWSPPSFPTATNTTSSTSDEDEDDGRGLNGIGYRPTPAIAWARQQKRREQLSNWKMREAKEARERRAKQRLLARSRVALRNGKATIAVHAPAHYSTSQRADQQQNDSINNISAKEARIVRFAT